MKCKYNSNVECDFEKPEEVRDDCRSFNCEPYEEARVNDSDREALAEQIKQGNISGILDSEDYRISWKIDIEKFNH